MKAIIWDFNGTLYNSNYKKLFYKAKVILDECSKKYQQALVSSDILHPDKRKMLIKKLSIDKYFDHIEINFKTTKTFLNICTLFKCNPKEFYVIGDNFFKEIKIGNKLGMKTIWFDFKGTLKLKQLLLGIKYWKKINKLDELENLLK